MAKPYRFPSPDGEGGRRMADEARASRPPVVPQRGTERGLESKRLENIKPWKVLLKKPVFFAPAIRCIGNLFQLLHMPPV